MTILGLDWRTRMASQFGDRLATATLTRTTVTGPDPSDSAGPPLSSSVAYTADGLTFAYEERFIDGEYIKIGDYQVTLLLGTMAPSVVIPNPGDAISITPQGASAPLAGYVVNVAAVTDAFVTCQMRGAGV